MLELAGRQHGVVAYRQLLALGLSRQSVHRRLASGRLHRLFRGVYAVGRPDLPPHGRYLAAVMAGGARTVLSHRSAAALWGVRATARTDIELSHPGSRRPQAGLAFHRLDLPHDEVTVRDAIPVTTVPRTLFDLGAVLPARAVERALNEAEVLRLWDPLSLEDLLERYPRRVGRARIRVALAGLRAGSTVTRSELEERFLAVVREYGLPRPRVNEHVAVGGRAFEVDAVWRERRLALELDSHGFHATPESFESDRERDRVLEAAGWRVVRITWRQLTGAPGAVVADLRAILGG